MKQTLVDICPGATAKRKAFSISLGLGLSLSLSLGCGLDPMIWGEFTATSFPAPPPAGSSFIEGRSTLLGAGAAVRFFTPGGVALSDSDTTTSDGGAFSGEFAASTELANTIVTVSGGGRAVWGLVPQLPKKATVYDEPVRVVMGQDLPGADGEPVTVPLMDDLDVESTTATLLLLAKTQLATPPTTLASLSPGAIHGALSEIASLLDQADPRLVTLDDMIAQLLEPGATTAPPLRPFIEEGQSFMDPSTLAAATDYDGDGAPDDDTAAFDAALEAAIGAFEFDVCYAPDTIRLVLIVDFRDGGMSEGNCGPIDKFKWLVPKTMTPDKSMFVTGAIHESTPNCDKDPAPCLDPAVADAASQRLGNWVPNVTPMYDDGTHGDAVAGDNLWTISLEMPYFDAGDPYARWVRIAYKYTWGTQGALWGGSEEWPGNQRILELRDMNGDHMIVRQDVWADETTNKDKANLRAPAKGGCGTVLWQSELHPRPADHPERCVDDTLERMIDTDGECGPDAWPSLFTASPITVPCGE